MVDFEKKARESIQTYEEAARVIHLWLKEFCDESLPYPAMIADAARQARRELDRLGYVPPRQWRGLDEDR